jgi:hypothetical protein
MKLDNNVIIVFEVKDCLAVDPWWSDYHPEWHAKNQAPQSGKREAAPDY